MCNVANIRRVADAIERHEIADLGFNMGMYVDRNPLPHEDHFGTNCGTTACIAGWAVAIDRGKVPTESEVPIWSVEASRILGIDHDTGFELFEGKGYDRDVGPAQAVRTLRHLADTHERTGVGVVDWDLPTDPA